MSAPRWSSACILPRTTGVVTLPNNGQLHGSRPVQMTQCPQSARRGRGGAGVALGEEAVGAGRARPLAAAGDRAVGAVAYVHGRRRLPRREVDDRALGLEP